MTQLMGCGHAPNAQKVHPDGTKTPSCAICAGIDPGANVLVEGPSLEGRTARCHCWTTRASSTLLAFFEYRGPGSRVGEEMCARCNFYGVAHDVTGARNGVRHAFVPHGPFEHDTYYCGCDGWN
jgi:hypothetical protein